MKEIINVLEEIIRDNFDDDTINITENTRFEEISDWDSMEQVNIITMVEEQYGFKFNVDEMTDMSNAKMVEQMAQVIQEKLK